MPDVTTRQMAEDEYAAYRERMVRTYADELGQARGLPAEAALQLSEESFPASLAEAPDNTWLLRLVAEDGADVGWLWLGPNRWHHDALHVNDVEIVPDRRGEGLGRAAMLAAERIARQAGMARMSLNVFGGNERAERLYRSLGYRVESTQMSKSLRDEP